MKRRFILMSAVVAALFTASCAVEIVDLNENINVQGGMKEVTITASVAPETKTAYDVDGTFSWHKGDQISIMGTDYNFYTLTANQGGATTTFTGYVKEGVTLRQEAFFPADPGTNRTESSYYFNIPQYKDLLSGSADLPMGAYSGTTTYVFKHITGAALLTFTNFPAEVVSAEIKIVNARLKLTGTFKAYLSSGLWAWNSASDVAEEERTLIRKVAVVNGQAQVYMPYNGSLWWDYTSVINITGYDADGNEYRLLVDKTMKPDEKSAERGVVYKYAPLALPDYVPEVNWNSVDWSGQNVANYVMSEDKEKFIQWNSLSAVADQYYLYVRLVADKDVFTSDKIGYMFADANATSTNWRWSDPYTYRSSDANMDGYNFNLKYNSKDVVLKTTDDSENIVWLLAFPRDAHTVTSVAGTMKLGFYSSAKGNDAGVIPYAWGEMLSVVLP